MTEVGSGYVAVVLIDSEPGVIGDVDACNGAAGDVAALHRAGWADANLRAAPSVPSRRLSPGTRSVERDRSAKERSVPSGGILPYTSCDMLNHVKQRLPLPIRQRLWQARQRLRAERRRRSHRLASAKQGYELEYWHRQNDDDGLRNDWYGPLMLRLAGEDDADFCAGLVVADFGCGPRGSLTWATSARMRLGIDVLADAYGALGIADHDMTYIWSTEDRIPLPSAYVDVLFTVNSLDHVDNLPTMCGELIRVLRPGGRLVGLFNLDEPRSVAEPQTLTEDLIGRLLLDRVSVDHRRVAPQGPPSDKYCHILADVPPPHQSGHEGLLWVTGHKTA